MDRPIVTVLGGSGFLGRHVVDALLGHGFAVRAASRHPGGSGGPSAATAVQADVNDDRSVAAAVTGAHAVVNAVSLYVERDGQTFESIHVTAAERVAARARQAGVTRLVHLSGIGSDADATSSYIRSRGRGELAVRQAFPAAILVRPAVMFGEGDAFVTPLLELLRRLPAFALFGRGGTRLQPVYVGDVAEGIARALRRGGDLPTTYELAGPHIYTYRELVRTIAGQLPRQPILLPMPIPLWLGLAYVAEMLPKPFITRNQVELMQRPNVAAPDAVGLAELGITPAVLEDLLPAIAAAQQSRTRSAGR